MRSGVQAAQRVHYVRPTYPKIAVAFRQAGQVRLEATINKQGEIAKLIILKPAGMGLDEAAIEAVRQWKYSPTLLKGNPVPVITLIDIIFKVN